MLFNDIFAEDLMNSVLCFLPCFVIILIYAEYRNRTKQRVVKNITNKRTKGTKKLMFELSKKFIGKECIICTLNAQIIGVIKEVSDSAILIDSKNSTEIVNLDYKIRLREFPRNKKGRKKSIVSVALD